jgi:putative membrane protein
MPDGWKSFLQRWFVTTLGVLAAAGMIQGIEARDVLSLLAASFLLGILNAFLRPVLLLLSLPLLFLTFGLFTLVINALLLYLVSSLVKGFYVADFWAALKGALLISVVSIIANMMLGTKVQRRTSEPPRPPPPPNRPQPPGGTGPIIDV